MKRNEHFTEAEIKEQKKRRKTGRRAMALLLAGMMLFSNVPSNVSAVSDNDISMLTSVKYGMAMGNGTENCRKAAPYVTDTNEKDGVAKGILRFLSEAE